MFANQPEFKITSETGKKILEWCESGIDELKSAIDEMKQQTKLEDVVNVWTKYKQYQTEKDFVEAKDEMKNKLKQE